MATGMLWGTLLVGRLPGPGRLIRLGIGGLLLVEAAALVFARDLALPVLGAALGLIFAQASLRWTDQREEQEDNRALWPILIELLVFLGALTYV